MQRSQTDRNQLPVRSELAAALAACRGAFYGTAVISGMSNVLMLTGAMFMLEIYDRVLPSRSMPPLVGLLVLVAVLFTALGDQFFSTRLTQPMASLPTTIFQFALSAYEDWQRLAWVGALLIAIAVLSINIIGRIIAREARRS